MVNALVMLYLFRAETMLAQLLRNAEVNLMARKRNEVVRRLRSQEDSYKVLA